MLGMWMRCLSASLRARREVHVFINFVFVFVLFSFSRAGGRRVWIGGIAGSWLFGLPCLFVAHEGIYIHVRLEAARELSVG